MKLTRKTSIIISTVGILIWTALFVLFYNSPQDYGSFGEVDFGKVRGAAVARFTLHHEDVLLVSRRGTDDFSQDVLLLVQKKGQDSVTMYVVREQEELVFEQAIAAMYLEAGWNNEFKRFEVVSASNEVFWLIPAENSYTLAPAK